MTAAILAVAVAIGGWIGIRAERSVAKRSSADLSAYLMSISADDWKS